MHPKDISILDYTYQLPEDRIATIPLSERDDSKLLVYRDAGIQQDQFKNIAAHLPAESLLVFNNTRVIQARILFQKSTGAFIEIFCLEPYEPVNEYATIMAKRENLRWKCLIGGASKWKEGKLVKKFMIQNLAAELVAKLVDRLPDAYVVELSWQPAEYSFAEIIEQAGETPLPPYIKRKAEENDKTRYQTIYAKHDGSVAAPTAGLHFTPAVFSSLQARRISAAYITLHVGAGTFKPVKAASMQGHQMHAEWIDIGHGLIDDLVNNLTNGIIAVGTTSLRTLESLYWMGVKASLDPCTGLEALMIHQWDVYEPPLSATTMSAAGALNALSDWMHRNDQERLVVQTQILIAPGYRFRMIRAIVTNFHQPQSTLLLLVAAAIGNDWKRVYDHALANDFRFLSYGDGSLLFLPG